MGAVLFELLAGQPPFDGDSMPEICAHVLCDPPRVLRDLRPEVPRGLEAVVGRCLEKDREERFADVAEFARALSKYASAEGRSSIPSIEHITSNSEPPHAAEHPRPALDANASFAPTILQQSAAASEQRVLPDHAAGARIKHIPGVSRRWPWLLGVAVVLATTGIGAAQYRGYDVVLPLRGVVIPGSLHEDSLDALALRRVLEPQFISRRGPARAERELDASTADAAPPSKWKQHGANVMASTPPAAPALPALDDPYGVPAGP
jgi:hypothetical protein